MLCYAFVLSIAVYPARQYVVRLTARASVRRETNSTSVRRETNSTSVHRALTGSIGSTCNIDGNQKQAYNRLGGSVQILLLLTGPSLTRTPNPYEPTWGCLSFLNSFLTATMRSRMILLTQNAYAYQTEGNEMNEKCVKVR